MLWQVLQIFMSPKEYYKFPKWSILSHTVSIENIVFCVQFCVAPLPTSPLSLFYLPKSFFTFPPLHPAPYFFTKVWIHLGIHSPVRFSSTWEENTTFSNILSTCSNYSGNQCVIPINICIFSSCLLNSSHPNEHICQARTCCNVCYKETTLGKSGIHRSCLSDEDTNDASAVKQFCNKNITLQVADLQVLDKNSYVFKPSYPHLSNLP